MSETRDLRTHVAAGLVGLLVVSFLVMRASDAAFTGQVEADAEWGTGTVAFDETDPVSLIFEGGDKLVPGETVTDCATLKYVGNVPSAAVTLGVSPDAGAGDGELAEHLQVVVAEGAGCGADTEVFAEFVLSNGLDPVEVDWAPAPEEERSFVVTVSFDPDLDPPALNELQARSASATFTWTTQSTPAD